MKNPLGSPMQRRRWTAAGQPQLQLHLCGEDLSFGLQCAQAAPAAGFLGRCWTSKGGDPLVNISLVCYWTWPFMDIYSWFTHYHEKNGECPYSYVRQRRCQRVTAMKNRVFNGCLEQLEILWNRIEYLKGTWLFGSDPGDITEIMALEALDIDGTPNSYLDDDSGYV